MTSLSETILRGPLTFNDYAYNKHDSHSSASLNLKIVIVVVDQLSDKTISNNKDVGADVVVEKAKKYFTLR